MRIHLVQRLPLSFQKLYVKNTQGIRKINTLVYIFPPIPNKPHISEKQIKKSPSVKRGDFLFTKSLLSCLRIFSLFLLYLSDSPYHKRNVSSDRQQVSYYTEIGLHQHIVDTVIGDCRRQKCKSADNEKLALLFIRFPLPFLPTTQRQRPTPR